MRTLILLSLMVAAAGCSRAPSSSAQNAVAPAAPASPGAAATAPVPAAPNDAAPTPGPAPAVAVSAPCDRGPLSPADVQPLLTGPITAVKPAPSDPDSCVFSTAGFSSISVTVRPDGGRQTLQSWRKGPVTPVPGVGDDAVWEPAIQEIVASHGDTLCTVTAMGPQVAPATAQTEGALCAKVFTAR